MDSKIVNKLFFVIVFLVTTQLNAIEFKGKFLQGHYIIGITDPSAKIIIDKKKVKVSKDGYFVFGIDRDRKFDLIITDIYIPKMNGITMITRIRELPNYKRVPILVLSVEFDQEYKKKGKSIGATGWIVKPFIPAQLVKAINFCLNRK